MKYIPLAGIGLVVWGLLTLDWFKVGVGVLIYLAGFIVDVYKKRAVLRDGRLFSVYKPLNELIRVTRKAIEGANFDTTSPKGQLAQALFIVGMVDAASQAAGFNDRQFLDLYSAVFTDHDFGDELQSRILLFHQSLQLSHPAYEAILKGGEVYTKFINGNRMIPLVSGKLLEEIVQGPAFPSSAQAL